MNIQELLTWTEEQVKALPSEYRAAAFQELLGYKLAARQPESASTAAQVSQSPTAPVASNWISQILSDLPPDFAVSERGSEEQRVAWAVLHLVAAGSLAVNKSIGEEIRLKLSVPPPSRQNINRALRKLTPKYLSREQHGRGLAYFPKPAIRELFANLT